ncbi:hypothetical protein OPV22_026404 [Ensete ventricosum]|uniref:Uncharacterized protein n=1 Tax=Ensete ventricosum TaxID=4639 RepID=A0AAV8PAP7_ENSVE|nr:hypothetical protein OPV22_026404 [Ensete ventricosum]
MFGMSVAANSPPTESKSSGRNLDGNEVHHKGCTIGGQVIELILQIFHQIFHMDAYGENISVVAMSEKPCAYSINHVLAGGTQHADQQTEMTSSCLELTSGPF